MNLRVNRSIPTFLLVMIGLLGMNGSMAQNEVDALRYTDRNLQGTARFSGLGGAFGALGADISVALINPAGLARFNKSEVAFTPGIYLPSSSTKYNNTIGLASDAQIRMGSMGLVGANRISEDAITPWRSVQFSITYNRLNMFDQQVLIQGDNTNSLLAVFAKQATGISPESLPDYYPFTSDLAYQTYTIDSYLDSNGTIQYSHRIPQGSGNEDIVSQTKTIESWGGMNETAISFSGNYLDKFYIGGSIGIPRIRYEAITKHSERALIDSAGGALQSFTYREDESTSGFGINGKIGVVFLPMDWIRIGAAIHTPSVFSMTDTWGTTMTATLQNGDYYTFESPAGRYSYVLRTPARFIGSAAVIIARKGLVSLDYEFTNYGGAKLRSDRYDNYSFNSENDAIRNLYKNVSELRIGTEWRIIDKFSVRGGVNYRTTPYVNGVTVNPNSMLAVSLGAGYRSSAWYIDASYTYRNWSNDHYLYDPALVNAATITNTTGYLSIGVGARY